MSPYEPLEAPLFSNFELSFGSLILGNSEETRAKLAELGIPLSCSSLFPNPAPQAFFDSQEVKETRSLGVLAIVSNHRPPELNDAIDLLRSKGIEIKRFGRGYQYKRIMPSDLKSADAIVTIGKSVQYGLAVGIPVFVYDRFGGPGWLGPENFNQAASFNFSGRGFERHKLSSSDLASHIVDGFADARAHLAEFRTQWLKGFSLSEEVDRVLSTGWGLKGRSIQSTLNPHDTGHARVSADEFWRIRSAALLIQREVQAKHRLQSELKDVRRSLERVHEELENLKRFFNRSLFGPVKKLYSALDRQRRIGEIYRKIQTKWRSHR